MSTPTLPATTKVATLSEQSGLARSDSLSNRLRSSLKGGVSSLLKKTENERDGKQKAKARRSSKRTSATPKPAKSAVELPATKAAERMGSSYSSKITASSQVDPSYDAKGKRFTSTDAQLPPVPTQKQKSFFDDSSSDEEDQSPVLQRASSVRVGKPTLVRHASSAAAHSAKKDSDVTKSSLSTTTSAAAPAETTATASKQESIASESEGPEAALRRLEGEQAAATTKPMPSPPSTTTVLSPGRLVVSPAQTTPVAAQPSPQHQPTSSVTAPLSLPFTAPLSPLSALHSNPVSPTTTRLSRTLSAPTPPNRNPNRRVQIRPSDLIISHSDHDHRLFRESIITTPYPSGLTDRSANRLSDIRDHPDEGASSTNDETLRLESSNVVDRNITDADDHEPSLTALSPHPMSPYGPGDRDRFPSLSSSDSLSLILSIADHPQLSTTVEINLPSNALAAAAAAAAGTTTSLRTKPTKSTGPTPVPFDDFALFTQLRTHLTTLLGPRTYLPRILSHTTPFLTPTNSPQTPYLDSPSFTAHVHNPSLGTGRTGWLLWLRNQQPLPTAHKRASSMFSSATHATHHSPHESPSTHTGTGPGSIPHTPHSAYPRMPFQRAAGGVAPHVVLHYRLSCPRVALASGLNFLLALLAVILWVLVGVPGRAAGTENRVEAVGMSLNGTMGDVGMVNGTVGIGRGAFEAASYGEWRVDAQMRVLTGLALGACVFVGGMVLEGMWILGGWVLL
jgi:hypothetical protein